jgi:hypothetical protein
LTALVDKQLVEVKQLAWDDPLGDDQSQSVPLGNTYTLWLFNIAMENHHF